MFITIFAMMSHTIGHLNGVIGTVMAQHVVSGWLTAGLRSGVNGMLITVGNITAAFS
tara:strand:- start:671 stop:841 length:171 start_codon:yes stop_codon:yes gene_type:complete